MRSVRKSLPHYHPPRPHSSLSGAGNELVSGPELDRDIGALKARMLVWFFSVDLHVNLYACNSRSRSRSRGIAEALLDVEAFTVAALGVLASGSVLT